MGEVLFVGPKSSGKSLLLKRLQTLTDEKRLSPFDPIPSTHPTDGVESSAFKFKGVNYIFKELGGSNIPDFPKHAQSSMGIVYVFDAADLTRTATNVVWLNDLLKNPSIENKPVLIVLSKCDVPDCVRFSVVDEIIGFDYVLNPARLSFLETSSVVGIGLSDIFKWVADLQQ